MQLNTEEPRDYKKKKMSKLHQNSIDFIYSELPHRLKNFNTYLCLTLFSIPFYWHKDWMEMPGSLLLLLVVAPSFVAYTIRDGLAGVFICLAIGCYLLQEHIRASGGFRNSFTKPHGVSNSVGIVLLLVYPIWGLVLRFL